MKVLRKSSGRKTGGSAIDTAEKSPVSMHGLFTKEPNNATGGGAI